MRLSSDATKDSVMKDQGSLKLSKCLVTESLAE